MRTLITAPRLQLCAAVLAGFPLALAGCTGPRADSSSTAATPRPAPSSTLAVPTVEPQPSFSGGPIQVPSGSPTTAVTAKTAQSVAAFLSPSKNIECGRMPPANGEPAIACQIFERTFTKPSCSGDQSRPAGTSVVVYLSTTGRPSAVACASDVAIPARPKPSAYGDRFAFPGGTECMVTRENVRCVNAAGHGFALARAVLTTF